MILHIWYLEENSMNCMVHGIAKSQTCLSNFHFIDNQNFKNSTYD